MLERMQLVLAYYCHVYLEREKKTLFQCYPVKSYDTRIQSNHTQQAEQSDEYQSAELHSVQPYSYTVRGKVQCPQ